MDGLIKTIMEIATGKKAKIFWAFALIIFIVFLALYPYIDANFLVYNRLNKRIEILDELTKLNVDAINSNHFLKEEYNSILNELVSSHDKAFGTLTNSLDSFIDKRIKFISGGIFFWFLSVLFLFSKSKKQEQSLLVKFLNKMFSILIFVGIGFLMAQFATKLPTIYNIWVNAIGFPIFQIVIIALLVYGLSNNN